MGGLLSRHNEGVQNIENTANDLYRFPPAQGKYFADYFILGGTKFDAPRPEAYLFGENHDLNLFSQRPVAFPYSSPPGNQPTKTLRSLLNLRKDTLKLSKCTDTEEETYHIEFTFDADVKCFITIYYEATQDMSTGLARFSSKDPNMTSVTFSYPKGSGQVFSNATKHRIKPADTFTEDKMNYNPVTSEFIPVVIQIEAAGEDHTGHSNITLATFEKATDGTFAIKPFKQKQMVDGVCYLLQEIYGIENKQTNQQDQDTEDAYVDMDDTGLECVICMYDPRDTLILPCRHLCLCRGCGESLRYQSSNCPICRSPFVALLQISAFIKKTSKTTVVAEANSEEDELPGYQEIPLVEALNGKIKPESIPEGSAARLRRRSSAVSLRSSSRKPLSRASSARSARSYRQLERSTSAGSALSRHRPGSAMKARVDVSVLPREEAKLEKESTSESIVSDDVDEVSPFEHVEATAPPLSEFLQEGKEQQNEVPELHSHMDVSLPGTPLSSSEDSGSSSRSNASAASAASATTPTCVRLEESEPPVVSV